jgi:hypothetical protein
MKILINNYEYYNILVIYMSQILIPENVIVKRKGRPPNPNSSRQQKLASTEPLPVKKLGRPKKVIEPVEEPKPVKKSRGRPVVEGSLRQQKKSEEKRPKGRPKKTETTEPKPEPIEPVKKLGRPSKCDSVPPKNNVKEPNTFTRPIIEWVDIDKKLKINPSQIVSPLLLKYSKMNKDLFFDIIEILLQNRLSGKVKREISKNPTKQDLFLIFKKICAFAIHYGFTTAYEIEQSLILRMIGDLQDKPAELKRLRSFLIKNCIGKQGEAVVKAKTATKPKKDKVYTTQELTNFYDVPIDKKLNESSLSFGDILANNFSGINKSIRLNENEKIEILDYEMNEEGDELTTKSWRTSNSNKMVLKGVVRRILDALKEANEDTYEELNKLYKEEPEYVFENLIDYM